MQYGADGWAEANVHQANEVFVLQRSLGALAGVWRGKVWIASDFDDLPDDLAESFGMKP